MVENLQLFLTYIGLTMFITGIALCFVASAFRFGVFCTLLGNVMFVSAIVFPIQIMHFLENVGAIESIAQIEPELLKTKAVMLGVILMGCLWSIRWFKHLIIEGFFYFVFPSLVKPKIVKKK